MKIKVFDKNAQAKSDTELDDKIFSCDYNKSIIHQVVVAHLNNKRQGTKSALTRSEVRGGGAKPWRQKGTGRARQGSIRAPQWNKGGMVFAIKPRDFSQKVNKQVKRNALFSALSQLIREERLIVVDDISLTGKTKEAVAILKDHKINKSALFIIDEAREQMVYRCTKNIKNVNCINYKLINVYDLVVHDKCIITLQALNDLQKMYNKENV